VTVLITVGLTLVLLASPAGAGDGEEPSQSLRGRLQERTTEGSEPVEGAELRVLDASGEEVGTAETDDEGRFEIPLDEPGDYRVELDLDSLPDGVTLTDDATPVEDDTAILEVSVAPNQDRVVVYRLGEGTTGGDTLGRKLAQRTFDGVQFGLLIAMGAIGLSLIYGTTGVVNFAHGEFVTWGGLVAFFANAYLLGGLHVVPATMFAVVIGGLFGYAVDRGIFRPLRGHGASLVAQLVITIGLSFLLRNFFQYLFGELPRPLAFGRAQDFDFWIVSINPLGVTIIVVSLIVLGAVGFALQTTRLGKAMRAVADNRDLAESSGIDVQRIISLVWFFGGGLAALGGTLVALDERAKFDIGFRLLLLIFAGVTLGGLGTAFGALVGSVIVGIFINISTIVIPNNLKNVGALLILILILMVRPQGIFGRAERVG
jgi:neutral amino acid transport system permease protein